MLIAQTAQCSRFLFLSVHGPKISTVLERIAQINLPYLSIFTPGIFWSFAFPLLPFRGLLGKFCFHLVCSILGWNTNTNTNTIINKNTNTDTNINHTNTNTNTNTWEARPLRPAHCQSPANGCPVHDGDDNYVGYDNHDDDNDDGEDLAFANWMKSALAILPSSFFNFDALFSSRLTWKVFQFKHKATFA